MAEAWFHGILRRCGNDFEKKNILELQKPGFAAPLSIIPCLPFCSLPTISCRTTTRISEDQRWKPLEKEEDHRGRKNIDFLQRDQDFWDITRTDGWAFQNLLVSCKTKRFGRFLHNNHEDLILQDYPDIKGSVQVGCFQSGYPTNPFGQPLMIIPIIPKGSFGGSDYIGISWPGSSANSQRRWTKAPQQKARTIGRSKICQHLTTTVI